MRWAYEREKMRWAYEREIPTDFSKVVADVPGSLARMSDAGGVGSLSSLTDAIFGMGNHIRYVAIASGSDVDMRQREDLTEKSSSDSDFYEELLVNPTILGIARRRGNLDCGGLRHVIIGYGLFNQVVLCTGDGHLSVAVELGVDPDQVAADLATLLERATVV